MKKNIYLILFALTLFLCDSFSEIFAQGATCAEATQLCDDPACGNFEISSGQGQDPIAGESSSCVGGDPNATWFFLIDDQGGGGTITIANTPACDTDFVAWGPFDSPADALAACAGGISPANEVGCDFGSGPGGSINVPGGSQVGDVYLMVITNFSDDPGITVDVTAPPLECCPVATGMKADVEICSGGTATSAITEFEGSAGEITGASQFIADLGTSTSATAAVAPTAADFTNNTCAPIQLELFHLYTCDSDCDGTGDAPSSAGSFMVTIFPDAASFVVTETPGACGTAAMVSIATADGTVCFTDAGAAPPAGTCPSTVGMAPLNYTYDPAFLAACNTTFSGTVAADCAPVGCSDCPDIAPAITAQEICSGADADFATAETEVNVTGNNVGAFAYFTDAAFATPYAGPLTNTTCDPIMLTIFGRLMCTDPAVAGTPDEFDDFSFMVTVYPDATSFVVTETPGACGTAATVSIATADGTVCFSDAGAVPPAGTCPSTVGMAPLDYTYDPAFLAACNATFAGTVAADCAPTGCSDCPDIAPAITAQEICAGDEPDFATAETEVNVTGNNAGAFTYFIDAAFATPYAGPLTNTTCAPIMLTIYGRLMCTDPGAAGTADEFDDFSFMVTVYPDANNFELAEVSGSCGVPSSVEVTAENGDVCFAETGVTPMDPGCDNPDDVQDLTYSFDPGFIAACNLAFGNTLPASCATTAMSPAPSFTCPTGPIDFCSLAGPIDLMQMDANNVGATGVFGGSAAGFVVGNQDPGMGATLDLSNVSPGNYTLDYTLSSPGCPPITTSPACTFELVINCNADGGRF